MESKLFLQQNLLHDSNYFFGYTDTNKVMEIADIWHDDSKNQNGRWKEIEDFEDNKGKILDMACGVGTFLLYGLHKGYDVYGLEPEAWKLAYIDRKIEEQNYPGYYKDRVIEGIGENIPFEDGYFDYVTTYQTLEHVQNVEKTLHELIRVLKVGGKLRIQAPDYNSFYEPHYCLPFLPKMNKKLARLYLRILGKPVKGLDTLQWTTSKNLKEYLNQIPNIKVLDLEELYFERFRSKQAKSSSLPVFLSNLLSKVIYYKYIFTFRKETQIKLVVWKLDSSVENK